MNKKNGVHMCYCTGGKDLNLCTPNGPRPLEIVFCKYQEATKVTLKVLLQVDVSPTSQCVLPAATTHISFFITSHCTFSL